MEILRNPLINQSELARQLYPKQKRPQQYLHDKLNNIQGKRITEGDKKDIEIILKKLLTGIII